MVNRSLFRFCRWLLKDRKISADMRDPAGRLRADGFFAELSQISRPVNAGTYAFDDGNQNAIGHIQLNRQAGEVTIHRIWATTPGKGSGSLILKKVCELADRHGIILKLAVNPLGVAPYPMSSRQLHSWYHRNGFAGDRKMIRLPRGNAEELNTEAKRHGEEKTKVQLQAVS
jgi:hypothetical protein